MTIDDLKAVAEKYPEWLVSFPINNYVINRGELTGSLHLAPGQHRSGERAAIFSALLDEIAEVEHGVYLVRKARAKTVIQSDPSAPWGETVWSWQARDIKTFQLHGDHPTKLAALLSL